MTDAKFCDLHPDQQTALIRDTASMWELELSQDYDAQVDNKMVTKTKMVTIHACAKCGMELLQKAKANQASMKWRSEFWTTKDGKRTVIREPLQGVNV